MTRYVARPVEVDAMQWTGENTHEVKEWMKQIVTHISYVGPPTSKDVALFLSRKSTPKWIWNQHAPANEAIDALVWDSTHDAYDPMKVGHFVVCGIQGEFYPCDPDVFTQKYEEKS